jgi:uncharacterized protein
MFEWDERKAAANFAKHYVRFEAVYRFDWETAVEFEDDRFAYDETRIVAIGWIDGALHTLTYTWRGESIRVISLRRSDKSEQRTYDTAKPKA